MSLHNSHGNSIRRYLLGDSSEQEREQIEERLMSGDGLYQELLVAEDDLIDDYVFDRLPQEDRPKFTQRFLHVPELRQNVSVTAALRKHALETQPQVVVEEPTPRRLSLFESLRRLFMQPAIGVAFAGALLGVIPLNVWLIRQNSQLKIRVGQLEAQQTAPSVPDLLQQLLASALQRNEQLSSEIVRQQELLAEESRKLQLAQEQQRRPTPRTTESGGLGVLAISLKSGLVRESGEGTTRVFLQPDTRTVIFRLDLAASDYASYRAYLRTAEGQRKWSKTELKITADKSISFEVPAKILVRGDYHIVLSGVKASGAPDEIDKYYFRVLR